MLTALRYPLPANISLQATQENWRIRYQYALQPKLSCIREDKLLLIAALTQKQSLNLLKQWLKLQAKPYLINRSQLLGQNCGLYPQKISIRWQKTRWGSCSSLGNINLNAKLLLLPEILVDYTIYHELCHLIHRNHGPKFWQTLELHCPNSRKHHQSMQRFPLPAWCNLT
jgi:predicted metal-dependent hydrolase